MDAVANICGHLVAILDGPRTKELTELHSNRHINTLVCSIEDISDFRAKEALVRLSRLDQGVHKVDGR